MAPGRNLPPRRPARRENVNESIRAREVRAVFPDGTAEIMPTDSPHTSATRPGSRTAHSKNPPCSNPPPHNPSPDGPPVPFTTARPASSPAGATPSTGTDQSPSASHPTNPANAPNIPSSTPAGNNSSTASQFTNNPPPRSVT